MKDALKQTAAVNLALMKSKPIELATEQQESFRLKCDSLTTSFPEKKYDSHIKLSKKLNLISFFVVFASITLISLAFVASISAHCWTSTPYHLAAKVSNQFFSQFYFNTLSTFLTFFCFCRRLLKVCKLSFNLLDSCPTFFSSNFALTATCFVFV